MIENFNTSYSNLRPDLVQLVKGKNLKILDVGCATGSNGEFLKKDGIAGYVEGIELDLAMAKQAADHIDKVIVGDIEDAATFSEISETKFDYILFGDILEHLKNPYLLLKKMTSNNLAKNGKIIISLPNVQHIEVLFQVFFKGKWPRNDRGIFDKTHLMYFTEKNIYDLLQQASLNVDSLIRVFRFRDRLGSQFPRFTKSILTRIFPRLFTFQYIVICGHEK